MELHLAAVEYTLSNLKFALTETVRARRGVMVALCYAMRQARRWAGLSVLARLSGRARRLSRRGHAGTR